MELDSSFSSLLRNLKVDDPWVPPKTWESIPSESGSDRASDSAETPQISTNDLSTISESVLVRLAINALQGLKSSIVQIDQLSVAFCSIPADRTFHQVPSLWCRSSSTSALGAMLKSISHLGLVVFSLWEFINHHLCSSKIGGIVDEDKNEMKRRPPYSLVNQAFSVAVRKVLEGYISALNTLLASVRLRRSVKHDGAGVLTSIGNSDVTLLEVYLHTEELRTHIEALGNVCFPKAANFTSLRESLTTDATFDFCDFPRGAELLTYLYVMLRDSDPCHHALLKFLFIESCEPYCAFIKSWIYHGRIDDPYGEFFVVYSHGSAISNAIPGSAGDFSLSAMKERDDTLVPCFLKDICGPLFRAGQQLEVLVKLVNMCKVAVIEKYESHNLADLENILPFWVSTPSNSASLVNQLTFSRKRIQALLHKRVITYEAILGKLQKFLTSLDVRYQRIHHPAIPFDSFLGRGIGVSSQLLLISDTNLKNTSITSEQEAAIHGAAGDTDASASNESLFDMGSSELSESSSSCSYEDEVEPGAFSELPDISQQTSESPFYCLHACHARKHTSHDSKTEKLPSPQHYSYNTCGTLDTAIPLVDLHNGKQNAKNNISSQMSITLSSDIPKRVKSSETYHDVKLSERCWPLGGLIKNPFYGDMRHNVSKQWRFNGFHQQKADGRMETLEEEEADFSEFLVRFSSDSCATERAKTKNSCYNLSINPMLAKTAWLRTVRNVRDNGLIDNRGPCYPCFDFSLVCDPFEGSQDNMIVSHGPETQGQDLRFVDSASPAIGVDDNVEGGVRSSVSDAIGLNKNSGGSTWDKMEDPSVSTCNFSSRQTNDRFDILPPIPCGGSGWEASLNYPSEDASFSDEDEWCDPPGSFEIPLDVIIDKCIVQEILTQYKYISNFAIKLLKECFDLHEHLVALKRYHFMEQADWADSFITSLHKQKWSTIEPEEKIAKTQELLDLALQRSSCGNDPYKERLFAYTKGENMISEPTAATDLNAFNFMALGYKVDWPINIIITQCALRTYADIFSFLFQVRRAIISLTDIWRWLKAGICAIGQSQNLESHKLDFRIVMKMRQQIHHFVRTLQEYVHCHLSDVSWCQFQQSLQHQVKDILDLESVHKSYLADAFHICFLSSETKPIAIILKNILQCALDFWLCFPSNSSADVESYGRDPLDLRCQINFSQVFAVKTTFERNIRDLYILYLKSPKHGDLSLRRFWSYVNYNDYYSSIITKETGFMHH